MKLLTDMLTESDNKTWCPVRVCGFGGYLVLVGCSLFAVIHYAMTSPAFDPDKVSSLLSNFVLHLGGVIGIIVGGVVGKTKGGADATGGTNGNTT